MTTQERDAWTFAYRLYDEYAPKLRDAAALDDDTACHIFSTALERIRPRFAKDGNDTNCIYLRVYDLLDDVFKNAQKCRLARAQDSRRAI